MNETGSARSSIWPISRAVRNCASPSALSTATLAGIDHEVTRHDAVDEPAELRRDVRREPEPHDRRLRSGSRRVAERSASRTSEAARVPPLRAARHRRLGDRSPWCCCTADTCAATCCCGTRAAARPARRTQTCGWLRQHRGVPGAQLPVGSRSNVWLSSTSRGGLPLLPAIRRAASSSAALIAARGRRRRRRGCPTARCDRGPAGPIASSMPWSRIVGIVWSRLCAYARIRTRCSAHFSAITITDR